MANSADKPQIVIPSALDLFSPKVTSLGVDYSRRNILNTLNSVDAPPFEFRSFNQRQAITCFIEMMK